MSSLGVSLLLLVLVAIAIAVAYNLRQGAWPRWEQALRRAFTGARAAGESARSAFPGGRVAPARTGLAGERGEPRLGAGLPADDEDDLLDAGGADPGLARPASGSHDGRAARTVPAETADRMRGEDFARPFAESLPDVDDPGSSEASAVGAARAAAVSPAGSVSVPVAASSSQAPLPSSAAEAAFSDDRQPEPAESRPAEPLPAASSSSPAAGTLLSEACDCIVALAPAAPLSGERLLAIAQRFRRAGSKPVAFEASATANGEGFEPLAAGRSYRAVRIGILMANRNGALNAMEFSEFVGAVQAIADALSARAEMPAMGSVLARARDLDATCAQLDVQIGVNVEAPEAVEPAQLAMLAPALSLVERGSHRYVRSGPQGETLFTLGFADSPSRLTFVLDVPRVAASQQPFAAMVQAASACAQRLGATLVDDTGRPLSAASLAQISRQLGQRYESLEAIGLPAGSALACKVFN
ncbi:MAG: hypothetical protein M9885_05295 [Burkholderiaceae bacterium]|nr:hypothetical protein [Burkholderiaceae bacterium]